MGNIFGLTMIFWSLVVHLILAHPGRYLAKQLTAKTLRRKGLRITTFVCALAVKSKMLNKTTERIKCTETSSA
jgi:hypothetical protein